MAEFNLWMTVERVACGEEAVNLGEPMKVETSESQEEIEEALDLIRSLPMGLEPGSPLEPEPGIPIYNLWLAIARIGDDGEQEADEPVEKIEASCYLEVVLQAVRDIRALPMSYYSAWEPSVEADLEHIRQCDALDLQGG